MSIKLFSRSTASGTLLRVLSVYDDGTTVCDAWLHITDIDRLIDSVTDGTRYEWCAESHCRFKVYRGWADKYVIWCKPDAARKPKSTFIPRDTLLNKLLEIKQTI